MHGPYQDSGHAFFASFIVVPSFPSLLSRSVVSDSPELREGITDCSQQKLVAVHRTCRSTLYPHFSKSNSCGGRRQRSTGWGGLNLGQICLVLNDSRILPGVLVPGRLQRGHIVPFLSGTAACLLFSPPTYLGSRIFTGIGPTKPMKMKAWPTYESLHRA